MPDRHDQRSQTSPFWIKVNGTDLQPNEISQVVDLSIEQDLVLPDVFSFRIRDVDDNPGQHEQVHNRLLDDDRFPVGATLEIGLGREEPPERVLKGEVTSLEMDLRPDGPLVTVRGYDGSHRLHRERKSRTFRNVSDSDIASRVARDYGLTPRVDSTPEVHEHVFQDNLSDWEFLHQRANRVGFELFVDDGKLTFRKPVSTTAPEQEMGRTLSRLQLRLSAPTQAEEVVVKGWDPASKRELTGRASRPSQRASIGERLGGGEMAQRMGTGRFVLAEQPVRTQGEADALAQSLYDEIAGDFLRLEGVCLGDPNLRPGRRINLKNLGKRFDGEYYLSAVTHRVTPHDGYLCHFTVSGRRPTSLTALLGGNGTARGAQGGGGGKGGGRHQGVVVGIVTNNKDTERGGRVKVKFPWLGDDESHWARLATPMAGDGRGFYFLPEVGDEVLVAFEHGDINHPYVVGGLWNGREKPPKPANQVVGPTGKVNQHIIHSRSGHTITLDDSEDQPSITIVDKTGQNTIRLDSTQNKLTINVQGDVAVTAQARVSIRGAMVEIQSSGPMTIKGATVNIN